MPTPRASATQRSTARRNSLQGRVRSSPTTAGFPGSVSWAMKSPARRSKRIALSQRAATAEDVEGEHHEQQRQSPAGDAQSTLVEEGLEVWVALRRLGHL